MTTQDSIEHFKGALRKATLDLMAKNENITAHEATEKIAQHFQPIEYCHDSDVLYNLFLRRFVHAVCEEQRLR